MIDAVPGGSRPRRRASRVLAILALLALLTACTAGDPSDEPADEPPDDQAAEPGITDRRSPEPEIRDPAAPDQPTDPDALTHGEDLRRTHVGLPDGWSGTPSGPVTSSYDGQIIEGLDVDASGSDDMAAIDVRHDDVTVRHVRVDHREGRNGVRFTASTTGGRVEFSEFYGHYRSEPWGNFGSIGVVGEGPIDVHRNYFQGGRDGVRIEQGPATISENWVEDLHQNAGAHNDGFAYMGGDGYANITFARNRTVDGNSGGIDLYALEGPVQGVQVVDNLIVGVNGGFGVYGGGAFAYKNDNRDVRIEGNRFAGEFRHPMTLGDGTNAGVDLGRPGNTFEDNRWVDSGETLPARCGVRQDACE